MQDAGSHPRIGRRIARVGLWLSVVVAAVAAATAALAAVGVDLLPRQPYAFNGLPFEPPEPAPNFALIDQAGRPVRLSDYRGQAVMLYFGFTHCPDECPITLGTWKQVSSLLGADATDVRFVMVTVDPERDTPERMGEYLAVFNPDFVGLSGSLEEIEDAALPYNVYFKRLRLAEEDVKSAHLAEAEDGHPGGEGHADAAEDYLVAHTTLTFVIDRAGQLVLAYPLGTEARAIAADLRHLLK